MQSGENGRAIAAMEELLGHGQTQYTERVLRVLAPMAYDEGEYRRSAEASEAPIAATASPRGKPLRYRSVSRFTVTAMRQRK